MKRFIYVAYDLSLDKIRRRLVKYLENYGHRVQYSVFCLRVTERELAELKRDITEITAPDRDKSVIFIPGEPAHITEVVPENLEIIGKLKTYRTESCVI
ncbi:CRISPR-associated endonuclease Cas2 [Succinimonas amylolytica]|uniref:CRISPR-associated endonuclease Cas2 n=1 Tax=Succinimonas amylolytica TaxID=83769 RepID=UPI000363B8EE|nr:CRISPR-associated endonuclease Cas2 [Succinimonas amylolytica]